MSQYSVTARSTRICIATLATIALLAGPALTGTPGSLTTTYAYNGGQSGNMFDLTATNNVTIVGFDGNYDVGSWTVEVYTCVGPYLPNLTTPGAWTLVASGSITSTAAGAPTPLGLALNIPIAAGQTTRFYITSSTGTSQNYTNGVMTGAVLASDANLTIFEGHGMSYPFYGGFNPREWNGTIYYLSGGAASAGDPYCFGDGSGASCPCSAFGAPGEGCAHQGGFGAVLVGSGSAPFSNDTLQFDISGTAGPWPGLLIRGDHQIAQPAGNGILCTTGSILRSQVHITNMGGTTYTDFLGSPFGAVANPGGIATSFQFFYRDPLNTCTASGFNFTNGWTVTYAP